MTRTPRGRWLAIAAVLSLSLTGCGSSHRNTGSGRQPTSSPPGSSSSASGSAANSTPASRSGAATGTAQPTPAGGDEDETGSPVEKCQLTSSAAVAAAFGAKVTGEVVTTSGIGSPLCQFKLVKSAAGAFGGVSATAIAKYPATAFSQSRKASPGAQEVSGLGSSAFYVPKISTLKVLAASSTALTLQYTGYLAGAGQPSPDQVRTALISLARGYLTLN